jgi:hypothetical protein
MDPYLPATDRHVVPDVVLEQVSPSSARRFVDVQNPAGDGLVTASDGSRLHVLRAGSACTLPDPLHGSELRFSYDPGFPVRRIFREFVRPALQFALLPHDAVAVHSASVEVDGAGIVIAGWSESGKTETALAFLESGGRFVSDKWSVVRQGSTVGAFPIGVGIRRWVLQYLPRLRAGLPRRARLQLSGAAVASGLTRPLRLSARGGAVQARAADVVDRVLALADRAALSPTEVRSAYGDDVAGGWEVPLRAVALLRTSSGGDVDAVPADPSRAAQRLASSAALERRSYFALERRLRFAFPERAIAPLADTVEQERALLRTWLAQIPVIDVTAPFPADPRRVADAIARAVAL